MSDFIKIAIIGAGNMGSAHLKSIEEIANLKLVAICDKDPEKKSLADEYDVPFFEDHHSLLAAKCCDAVVIATPHFDHTIIGIDALGANVHVLVEKPLGVHKADCQRLIAAYKNKDKVFV